MAEENIAKSDSCIQQNNCYEQAELDKILNSRKCLDSE